MNKNTDIAKNVKAWRDELKKDELTEQEFDELFLMLNPLRKFPVLEKVVIKMEKLLVYIIDAPTMFREMGRYIREIKSVAYTYLDNLRIGQVADRCYAEILYMVELHENLTIEHAHVYLERRPAYLSVL